MPREFIPVERGAESLLSFPDPPLTPLKEGEVSPSPNYPKGLKELPYTGTLSKLMDVSVAVQMGLPVAGLEAEGSRQIFVQQFQRYAWVRESGQFVMYGVAIRWLVDIKQVKAKFQVGPSLPMLTAAAQLGYLNATVRFDAIGLISSDIDAAIPAPTVLSVETHAEYASALKQIKSMMWDETKTTVLPQPLILPQEGANPQEDQLAEAWVVFQISDGASLGRILDSLRGAPDDLKRRVRAIYERQIGHRGEDKMPGDSEVKRAQALIKYFPFKKS